MKQVQTQFQNDKQKFIHSILTQNTQFQAKKFTQDMLNIDLVLKLKVPDNQYMPKSEDIPLNQFIYNPTKDLQKAYDIAYQDLLKLIKIRQVNQQKIVQIPNKPHIDLVLGYQNYIKYEVVEEELPLAIIYDKQMKDPRLTAFTLKYNTLMYVLQQKCGFKVFSYLSEQNFIYILVTQTESNLLKSADRYKIKKEVDYSQIDLFLNDPCDYQHRPYKYNTKVTCHQNLQKLRKQLQIKHQIILKGLSFDKEHNQQDEDNFLHRKLKRINRKLNEKSFNYNKKIVQEVDIWSGEVQKFNKYFTKNIQSFQEIVNQQFSITPEERAYILSINRNKINDGCYKQYILKKKRKKYFNKLIQLNQEFNYQLRQKPISYFQFSLPSKRQSFFQRLRSTLLYEEYVVSPYGDLSLFVKMQRIKVAFMVLKQQVRAQNLKQLNCEVFALHDDFQLYGQYQNQYDSERKVKIQIKGGINGKNVSDSWSVLTPWTCDIQTLRNYFGEDTVYGILLKNHLITYFMIITPLGIGAQIISRLLIYYNNIQHGGLSATSQQELAFHLIYFTITIILYNVFLQIWNIKQGNYFQNFVSNQTKNTFKYGYRGPFIRNLVTDSINQYPTQTTSKFKALKVFFTLIMTLILFASNKSLLLTDKSNKDIFKSIQFFSDHYYL